VTESIDQEHEEEFGDSPRFADIDHKNPPIVNPQFKKRMGRPPKYHSRYAQELVDFFDIRDYLEARGEHVTPGGKVIVTKKGFRIPTIEGFAVHAGLSKNTVYKWAAYQDDDGNLKYPDFSHALEFAQAVQSNLLVNGGMSGEYNSGLVKMILSAHHDYIEKTKTDLEVSGAVKILVDEQDEDA